VKSNQNWLEVRRLWREATYQACSKQKWSGPAGSLIFSACSVDPRAGEAGDHLFMAAKSMESFPFSSYQEALQGTAGHCFLLLK